MKNKRTVEENEVQKIPLKGYNTVRRQNCSKGSWFSEYFAPRKLLLIRFQDLLGSLRSKEILMNLYSKLNGKDNIVAFIT